MIAPEEIQKEAWMLHSAFMQDKNILHRMSEREVQAILKIETKGGHLRHKVILDDQE